jgi:hypothetical protein
MHLEPYVPRHIHFVELWREGVWSLKLYTILHPSKTASPEVLGACKAAVAEFLPQPAVTPERYGVGFLSLHRGKSYDFISLGWWAYETELHQQSFIRPSGQLGVLEPLSGTELSSDVWDLRLLAFEREIWLEEVLKQPDEDCLERYLARRLSESV